MKKAAPQRNGTATLPTFRTVCPSRFVRVSRSVQDTCTGLDPCGEPEQKIGCSLFKIDPEQPAGGVAVTFDVRISWQNRSIAVFGVVVSLTRRGVNGIQPPVLLDRGEDRILLGGPRGRVINGGTDREGSSAGECGAASSPIRTVT
ncbi:MAG: hypothetical protein GEU95_21975 [Rhizobiales bacterium]|nr:hypothetical protein [Hyphomicrobiales bacterium]